MSYNYPSFCLIRFRFSKIGSKKGHLSREIGVPKFLICEFFVYKLSALRITIDIFVNYYIFYAFSLLFLSLLVVLTNSRNSSNSIFASSIELERELMISIASSVV